MLHDLVLDILVLDEAEAMIERNNLLKSSGAVHKDTLARFTLKSQASSRKHSDSRRSELATVISLEFAIRVCFLIMLCP